MQEQILASAKVRKVKRGRELPRESLVVILEGVAVRETQAGKEGKTVQSLVGRGHLLGTTSILGQSLLVRASAHSESIRVLIFPEVG